MVLLLFLFFITTGANPNPNLFGNIFHKVTTLSDFIFGQHQKQFFNKYIQPIIRPTQSKFYPNPFKITHDPNQNNHLPPKQFGIIPDSGRGINGRLPSYIPGPSNGNYPETNIELGSITNHPEFASKQEPPTTSETKVDSGIIPVSVKGINVRLPYFPSNVNYPIKTGDTNHPNVDSSINPDSGKGINDRLPSYISGPSNENYPDTKIELGVIPDTPKSIKSRSKMQLDSKQIKTELGTKSTENYPKSNEEFGIVSEASFIFSIDPR